MYELSTNVFGSLNINLGGTLRYVLEFRKFWPASKVLLSTKRLC